MSEDRGILSLVTVALILAAVTAAVAWRLVSEQDASPATVSRPDLPSTENVTVSSIDVFEESRPVEGAPVIRDTLWIQVVGSGVAVASRQSQVASRSAGVVQRVLVREGDRVRQGDLLVQLDTAQAMMNLIRAQTALVQARAHYEQRRIAAGSAADLLSADERADRDRVVRAETGLTEAELAVEEREIELEFTRVRAPFSGRVADLRAVEGAYLSNGEEVLKLVQLDPIRIVADVLEGEIGLIAVGRRATVRINALGGETVTGVVESINPRVDPNTRTGRVTLSVPNPAGRILPGNYAWVSLDTQPLADRILVPREAVTTRSESQRDVVFLLEGADEAGRGLAGWRYVAVGRRNDRYVEIVPGEDTAMLEAGDIVLINGHHYLAHHTAVHLVDNVYLAGGTPGR